MAGLLVVRPASDNYLLLSCWLRLFFIQISSYSIALHVKIKIVYNSESVCLIPKSQFDYFDAKNSLNEVIFQLSIFYRVEEKFVSTITVCKKITGFVCAPGRPD